MTFAHDTRTIPADDVVAALHAVRAKVADGAQLYPAVLCIDGSPERGTFTSGYLAAAKHLRDACEARTGRRLLEMAADAATRLAICDAALVRAIHAN